MKDLLKLILLNKAYYHLISGYASLAKKVRGSLSSIAHFDIAVELKLNAVSSSPEYKRFNDPELLRRALIKLLGLDDKLIKKFQKYVSDFKEVRNKAIHFGYLTPSSLSKLIIHNLTDFMLYEINKSYLNEKLIEVLDEIFDRNKIISNNSLLKIPPKSRHELTQLGLLIHINNQISGEINKELLNFFAMLDNDNDFEHKILKNKTIALISPLLYLCSPIIRTRVESFNRYVFTFWRKYSRFKIRLIITATKNPENQLEYINELMSYAKKLAKMSARIPNTNLDFLYSGIAKELNLIIIKYERLKKCGIIDKEMIREILEILSEKLKPKQNEADLLYKKFLKIKENRIQVTFSSMLSEAALLHLIKVIKEIFPYRAYDITKAIRNTLITHLNYINSIPILLRE